MFFLLMAHPGQPGQRAVRLVVVVYDRTDTCIYFFPDMTCNVFSGTLNPIALL